MKRLLKFVAALCVALAIVLGVRAVAFTICTVPVDIGDKLHRGDKVMVNKLSSAPDFSRGDIIVYDEQGVPPRFCLYSRSEAIGEVVAIPGDTIHVGRQCYRIPYICCDRYGCNDCRLYLVDTGHGRRLVHKHQVVGKGYRLL